MALRPARDGDWEAVGRLADAAVGHLEGAPRQHAWLAARRAFAGWRRHWVAEEAGALLAYAGLERADDDAPDHYRLFLVTRWRGPLEAVEALHAEAVAELARLGARGVWMREYADDEPMLAFLRAQGFERGAPYTLPGHEDEPALVNLRRALAAPSA